MRNSVAISIIALQFLASCFVISYINDGINWHKNSALLEKEHRDMLLIGSLLRSYDQKPQSELIEELCRHQLLLVYPFSHYKINPLQNSEMLVVATDEGGPDFGYGLYAKTLQHSLLSEKQKAEFAKVSVGLEAFCSPCLNENVKSSKKEGYKIYPPPNPRR
jgi:hypothetical protein